MEVIQIPGYTQHEKSEIALKHLIPRQIIENGLTENIIEISRGALELIISGYTREAGVRQLERSIGAVCRHVAVKFSKHKKNNDKSEFPKALVVENTVREVLGVQIYDMDDIKDRILGPGTAIGMAWTQAGGRILFIETSISKGKGRFSITGQLGSVMKESVETALAWIRSNAEKVMGRDKEKHYLDNYDIHIHFPAAAMPKDGPSAGVTITTALVSLLMRMKVRSDVSMTGEISLKGVVLPVGGIKEKCLAAYQAGITTIILPYKNKKDTEEIQAEIKDKINFVFAKTIYDVLDVAFEPCETLDMLRAKLKAREVNKLSKL
jgi:ATP-dependent Lon protease